MRAPFAALMLILMLMATPSLAETITPCEADQHVGQSVTVEGAVNEVHHAASGRVTFVDMGGHYPNNCFAGVIFSDDAPKFPAVDSLNEKTIDVSGPIRLYQGRPEMILNDPIQIKIK